MALSFADKRTLGMMALVVREYDEAIAWYTQILGFQLFEDTPMTPEKRWVVVGPPNGAKLLLARGVGERQTARVGDQTGGRVFLFLYTDDLQRDHDRLSGLGVTFVRPPTQEAYGAVAVFADLYGNLWDLIQPA